MSANKAHRGRYRTYIGLAVASAAGCAAIVGPVLAGNGGGPPEAGVLITKTASASSVAPGGAITYEIRVTNTGQNAFPENFVALTDPSADAPPVLVKIEGGNGKGKWPLGNGETAIYSATRTFPADLAQCGTTFTNTATVTVGPPAAEFTLTARTKARVKKARPGSSVVAEPGPWSLSASGSAGVLVTGGTCPVPPPVGPSGGLTPAAVSALRPAALGLEKTGPTRMLAGGFGAFQIRVTNTGQTDATDVVLRDLPPSALLWRSVPAGAKVSGRNAEWKIGTIAAGQSVTKTVSFRARLNASGRLCNTATVSSAQAGAALDRACTTIVAARRPATPVTG